MSSDQNKYGIDHLIGGATLPKDANPTIRGSIRRADPDGNPEPHFTGLNGTTLNLDYSPTGAQAINFTSDDLDDAITAINAVDALNLKAAEEDGYLRLSNLNGGSKNYLKVAGGTAVPILGFRVDPLPGSASFAGEISTASPGRQQGQNNPHGTALVAGDEDLTSAGINRAIIGALLHAERLAGDLDLESLAVQEVAVTVQAHPISGERVFRIQDPTLRIPIRGFGIAVSNPAAGLLDSQFMIMEISGGQSQEYIDPTNATFYGRVVNVYYDDLSNTLDDTASFVAWGTPDGKSIFNKTATDDKHAATAITLVDGDVISVTGATFQALDCSPGDTVLIEAATNNDPFNHNGEFIITEVFSEEDIRVRPKTSFDRTFSSTDIPRGLNQSLPGGTSYGTLKVLIGDFISASDLVFEVAPTAVPASSAVRMLIGRRVQETRLPLADAGLPSLNKSNVRVAELIRIHSVTASSLRHASSHIDAPAVAGAPDSLTIGTVEAQLAELLTHINNLIAGQVTYGGGVNWADGTPNPSVSLEAQVDKMLNDLTGAAGSAKLSAAAGPAWADTTTNPAERLDQRTDSIIDDLANVANDGAAKLHALAAGNLLIGTLRAQLTQLDTEWLRLARANTVSATQTFTATQKMNQATGTPSLVREIQPGTNQHDLIWESPGGTGLGKIRIYSGDGGVLSLTVNAEWGSVADRWTYDDTDPDDRATMIRLTSTNIEFSNASDKASGEWTDAEWDELFRFRDTQDTWETAKTILPISGSGIDLGALVASDSFGKVVTRFLGLGEDALDLPNGRFLSMYGSKSQYTGDYISKYQGIWARAGHRFFDDFIRESTAIADDPWVSHASGTGASVTGDSGNVADVRHLGTTAGHMTLYLDHLIVRLTDGVMWRFRMDVQASFTSTIRVGFFDSTVPDVNELSLNYDDTNGFRVERGVGTEFTDLNNDAIAAGQRWFTFCLIGTRLSWVIDTVEPDPESLTFTGSGPDDQTGSATITVPTGLSVFGIQAETPGSSFEARVFVDQIEVITLAREF